MDIVFDSLTISEIAQIIASAEKHLADNHIARVADAQQRILAIAEEMCMTVEEIMSTKTKSKPKKPVKPKYINPNNGKDVWSGRGKKPLWVVMLLDAGYTLDELSIDPNYN